MNKKVKSIVRDNEEASRAITQMATLLGIYQAIIGDLPADVVIKVQNALNPAFVTNNVQDYMDHVRDTAARLAQENRQRIETENLDGGLNATVPVLESEVADRTPYKSGNASSETQPSLQRRDTGLPAPAQRSILWTPVSRS